MVNAEPGAPSSRRSGQSLSVHVYSPPLTAMSYYGATERGTLRRTHSVLTEYPADVGLGTVVTT